MFLSRFKWDSKLPKTFHLVLEDLSSNSTNNIKFMYSASQMMFCKHLSSIHSEMVLCWLVDWKEGRKK